MCYSIRLNGFYRPDNALSCRSTLMKFTNTLFCLTSVLLRVILRPFDVLSVADGLVDSQFWNNQIRAHRGSGMEEMSGKARTGPSRSAQGSYTTTHASSACAIAAHPKTPTRTGTFPKKAGLLLL